MSRATKKPRVDIAYDAPGAKVGTASRVLIPGSCPPPLFLFPWGFRVCSQECPKTSSPTRPTHSAASAGAQASPALVLALVAAMLLETLAVHPESVLPLLPSKENRAPR